ncbi:MAG: phage baseplate assembly protein [Smithella sp.]|jgi:phage gp45-like
MIRGMIRGIVISIKEGLIKLFSASGRTDESFDQREYFQHYGFTSQPLPGAEIIIIREGNHILGIASDDRRYRLSIENGEVALYTDEGDYIALKRGNNMVVNCKNKLVANVANEVDITTPIAKISASTSIDLNSPAVTVEASGSVQVNSPSIILGSQGTTYALIDARLIPLYDNHTHGSDGTPVVKLAASAVKTSITKAG